jgi:hypothetical protein
MTNNPIFQRKIMPDFSNRFAPVGLAELDELSDSRTRCFEADGSELLAVPGLIDNVDRVVLVNGRQRQELPLTQTRTHPLDATFSRFETIEEPLVKCAVAPDGTPILLRSRLSNGGLWQQGTQVYVTADYE